MSRDLTKVFWFLQENEFQWVLKQEVPQVLKSSETALAVSVNFDEILDFLAILFVKVAILTILWLENHSKIANRKL